MKSCRLMLGNEAIARGLLEAGCAFATSYPGTPASEILSALVTWQQQSGTALHAQWAINEKVAFEIAYAASIAARRAAVSMKQVGLNVASDPLMSAAYMGTQGGFVVISADDPGPHSSQTEQDSRMMSMMAKIPVLDPDSPAQAKALTLLAFEISERFQTPVMLRPTTRVCHARQDVALGKIDIDRGQTQFTKDPGRWAATPKFRHRLHGELEVKLASLAAFEPTRPRRVNPDVVADRAVVASGVAAAHAKEIFEQLALVDVLPLFQVVQPFPLHREFITRLRADYREILVLEETTGVIELQIADWQRVRGKFDQTVPRVGELSPETIAAIVAEFAGLDHQAVTVPAAAGRRPTLCAGCPHRASFFAIKKAAPKGIYTSDIGCYTLGLNLGAVDTVLCMGAAISQAAGFYHAHKHLPKPPPIVATMGDSTFFHAGVPALIDAVVQNAGIVLVILDNRTTAMTGNQPTPASGIGAGGEALSQVPIEPLVRGCGVRFCKKQDPYDFDDFKATLKAALAHSRTNGPAVVIAEHPCLLDKRHGGGPPGGVPVAVNDNCEGCGFCVDRFECPALALDADQSRVTVDPILCSGCGVCLHVCPKHALEAGKEA